MPPLDRGLPCGDAVAVWGLCGICNGGTACSLFCVGCDGSFDERVDRRSSTSKLRARRTTNGFGDTGGGSPLGVFSTESSDERPIFGFCLGNGGGNVFFTLTCVAVGLGVGMPSVVLVLTFVFFPSMNEDVALKEPGGGGGIVPDILERKL